MPRTMRTVLLGAVTSAAIGCLDSGRSVDPVEERSSALISQPHFVTVPAYFSTGAAADWTYLEGEGDQVTFVVVNAGHSRNATETKVNGTPVLGGPGTSTDTTIRDVTIPNLHEAGITVLGYVYYRFQRLTANIQMDFDAWNNEYHVDGLFFDVAGRDDTQGGVGRVQYWADRVRTNIQTSYNGYVGWSLFNWGGISDHAKDFIECGIRVGLDRALFVTFEGFAEDYTDDWTVINEWAAQIPWVRTYRPFHFVHLIHDAPWFSQPSLDTYLHNLMVTAANRNAQHVYITDQTFADNPWDLLAGHDTGFDVWVRQIAKAAETYSFDGAVSDPAPPTNCAAMSSEEAGPGT